MRWWRKPARYRPSSLSASNEELRRRAAEEDRVCAFYGPECERVEDNWEPDYGGHVRTVTYRSGRVQIIYPGSSS